MNCQRTKKFVIKYSEKHSMEQSTRKLRKQKCFLAHYKDIKTVSFAFKKLNKRMKRKKL